MHAGNTAAQYVSLCATSWCHLVQLRYAVSNIPSLRVHFVASSVTFLGRVPLEFRRPWLRAITQFRGALNLFAFGESFCPEVLALALLPRLWPLLLAMILGPPLLVALPGN